MTKCPRSFTRQEIQQLTEKGEKWIIFQNKVYEMKDWMKKHPGGELAIQHKLGKDATEEMLMLHPHWITKYLKPFYVGDLEVEEKQEETEFMIQSYGKFIKLTSNNCQDLLSDYHNLHQKFQTLGFYETNYWNYFRETCRCLTILTLSLITFYYGRDNLTIMIISSILLGIFWQQIAFIAHDAGHNSITHDSKIDTIIGTVIAGLFNGLSIGWWKKSHNVHHIKTNDVNHDPDIQLLPFFAISKKFFGSVYSSYYRKLLNFDDFARFTVPFQHYLYYPILSFGRFNLYSHSLFYLLTEEKVQFRWLEFAGIFGFWCWFSYLVSFLPSYTAIALFVFISHATTFILHVQITLSHFAMETDVDDRLPFPVKMLATTMDVDCSTALDWFHGGLQFQTLHHLYPRIPRHHLRLIRPYIIEFCKKHRLQYHSYNFFHANSLVIRNLKSVATQLIKSL